MSSDWIYYFGYGSLVNRETRPQTEAASVARLKGWQRVWEHRVRHPESGRRCTSMSIEPVAPVEQTGATIDGLVVRLPRQALGQLDERESGYERLSLPVEHFELPEHVATEHIMVYRSHPQNRELADHDHPVLQSYVDCIMAGYQREFGAAGLQSFLQSTRGWERPIVNDRLAPRYPRSVSVEAGTLSRFDASIRQHILDLQR